MGCRTGVGARLSKRHAVSIHDRLERIALTMIDGMAVVREWILGKDSDIATVVCAVERLRLRIDPFIIHSPL